MKYSKFMSAALASVMAISMFAALGTESQAASTITVNSKTFPDANFRKVVSKSFDSNSDGKLSADEIKKATYLSAGAKDITSLQGIEYLTELTSLSASSNKLTSVNLTKNTKLTSVNLSSNNLNAIDVTKNTKLTNLSVDSNKIKTLNVTRNTALQYLNCSDNLISSLDLTKNTKLLSLNAGGNKFTSLNISKNTALETLYLYNSKFSSIDISKNTKLKTIDISHNEKLKSLDVSKNTKLQSLDLDLCYSITSVNVKNLKNLKNLALIGDEKVSKIDVTTNTNLETLWLSYTNISSINVTKNTNLRVLDLSGLTKIKSLDVSKNTQLYSLGLTKTSIPSVNIAKCTLLVEVYKDGDKTASSYSVNYHDKIAGKYCDLTVNPTTQIVISWPSEKPSKATIAFVERLYTKAFKRKAEAGGRDYWSKELASHRTTGEIAGAFFFVSDEMVSYKLSDSEYVNRLYATFMDRSADADGKKYWLNFLKQGHSRLEVVMGFTRSPEFITKCEDAGILPYRDA